MNFNHWYYVRELQADRERQIMKIQEMNELRRAREGQITTKAQTATTTGKSWLGLRRRPAPAK